MIVITAGEQLGFGDAHITLYMRVCDTQQHLNTFYMTPHTRHSRVLWGPSQFSALSNTYPEKSCSRELFDNRNFEMNILTGLIEVKSLSRNLEKKISVFLSYFHALVSTGTNYLLSWGNPEML